MHISLRSFKGIFRYSPENQPLQYSKISTTVEIWLSELLLRLPFGFSWPRCSSFHQKSCKRWSCTPGVTTPNFYWIKSKFWIWTVVAEGGHAAFFATIAWWQQSHQFLNHDICHLTLAMSVSQRVSHSTCAALCPTGSWDDLYGLPSDGFSYSKSRAVHTSPTPLFLYIARIYPFISGVRSEEISMLSSSQSTVGCCLNWLMSCTWIVNEGQIKPMYECNAPVEAKTSDNPGLIIYLVQHFCW